MVSLINFEVWLENSKASFYNSSFLNFSCLQVEAVRILLEFQADKEHRDSDGNKPSQIVGLTMPVTKRKMKQIQCLLDPEAVFGGCGESNQENNGHEQGQNHDESQNYQQGGWTEPPSFYPVHIPPGENLDEVINGSNQTRNEG